MATGDPVFQTQEISAPATDFAIARASNSASTPVAVVRLYEFSDSSVQYLDFFSIVEGYDGGGLDIHLAWGQVNAGSGNVRWEVGFRRLEYGVDDFDASHAYSYVGTTVAANGTAGVINFSSIAVLNSEIDGIVDRDYFILRLRRNTGHAGDTLATQAELHALWATES